MTVNMHAPVTALSLSTAHIFYIAISALILLTAICFFAIILKRRRRSKKDNTNGEKMALEISNLQGIGARSEQQDAFCISRLDDYPTKGLLAVVCDGMGGLSSGSLIAREATSGLIKSFNESENLDINGWIDAETDRSYAKYRGQSGATLVTVYIRENELSFWSIGDSDIYLLREDELYRLNRRQTYANELAMRAIDGAISVEDAYNDPQAASLCEFLGKKDAVCEHTRIPLPLEKSDCIMMCSDGIRNTLTFSQIKKSMALSAEECVSRLEREIKHANSTQQDNYTAIIIKTGGK